MDREHKKSYLSFQEFQDDAKEQFKHKTKDMRGWYKRLIVCTVILCFFVRIYSAENALLLFSLILYAGLLIWALIYSAIAGVIMDGAINNRVKNTYYHADLMINRVVSITTYMYIFIPLISTAVIRTDEDYSFGLYMFLFVSLTLASLPVVIPGLKLMLNNKSSYSAVRKQLIRIVKNCTSEQLVVVANMTDKTMCCIDYNSTTGRILVGEDELKEILGESKAKEYLQNAQNRLFLIAENTSDLVAEAMKKILNAQSDKLIGLKSYITVLNVGFSVDEPEEYRYYEALFYNNIKESYQLDLIETEQLWQERDSLKKLDMVIDLEAGTRKKAAYTKLLKFLLFCAVICIFIKITKHVHLIFSFLLVFIIAWVAKKIKTKRIMYQDELVYDIMSWGLMFHGFISLFSLNLAFLPEFISVWVISRIKRIVELEADSSPVTDFKPTYQMNVDVQKKLNVAFQNPLAYCKEIETMSEISMPEKFIYGKLHTFFQNALLFPNASRSAMALLDYIEMCLRLVLYSMVLHEDNSKELKPEVVSFNLRKMAEKIYLCNNEQKILQLDRTIPLGDLEKGILYMLSDELQTNFSGNEIDFVGLVSIVTLVRNKLIAHGVMREDNITMLWIFLVYAAIQLTVYLEIQNYNVQLINNEYQIGHNGHVISGGHYLYNSNGNECIASSADKKRKKYVYTNYFSGELIIPEYIEESIDTK